MLSVLYDFIVLGLLEYFTVLKGINTIGYPCKPTYCLPLIFVLFPEQNSIFLMLCWVKNFLLWIWIKYAVWYQVTNSQLPQKKRYIYHFWNERSDKCSWQLHCSLTRLLAGKGFLIFFLTELHNFLPKLILTRPVYRNQIGSLNFPPSLKHHIQNWLIGDMPALSSPFHSSKWWRYELRVACLFLTWQTSILIKYILGFF